MTQRTLLLTAAAATVLGLAACNQASQTPATGAPIASLPLAQAAPPPETVAPQAYQLPPAPPIRRISTPRRPVYSYVDDAYRLGDAFADSPPDYTVDYDGERPWVWRSGGGEYRVVEQTPDGWREYYYRGDSDYPFLVRDAGYAYAYDGPVLVEVYDSYGRPYRDYRPSQADFAARYLIRARALYDAAIHQQRRAAYAADWRDHRDAVLAQQQQWALERQRNDEWRRFHDERDVRDQPRQAAWEQERALRQAYAARTAALVAAAASPRERAPEPRRDFGPGQVDALRRQQADIAAQAARQQLEVQPQGGRRDQVDAQRRQAELVDEARRQQALAQGQAQAQAQAQAEAQRRQAELAARDQQRIQAETARRARGDADRQVQAENEARRQQQQTEIAARQALAQQRAQSEAQLHARDEAARQQAQAALAVRAQHDQQIQAEQARNAARVQHDQQAQAERLAHDQQAQAAQAARAQHEQQAQAEQARNAARLQHDQQLQAERAARDQQAQAAQAARAQHEQQAQADQARNAARAAHDQQAQAERAAQQQAQAEGARREQQQRQAQAVQAQQQAEAARRNEQQQRQAQVQAAQAQQHQAEAAQQHAQAAAAQAAAQQRPHPEKGKPDKAKDKPDKDKDRPQP